MKNFKIEQALPLLHGAKFSFNELIERESKFRNALRENPFEKQGKFPCNERMESQGKGGRIVRIEGIPFLIVAALINNPHDYVEHEISKIADQLDKLALNLPGAMETKYKFVAGDITHVVNDAAYVRYYATKHVDGPSYAKRWTIKGEESLYGTGTSISAWPVGVDVSTPPTEVAPGIIARYREIAQRIKVQKSIYSVGDGEYLGIEKGHSTIDPSLAKPHLRWDLVAGGHPELKFVKSIYDGIELQKNWSDGKGMVALDKPKLPHYTDMGALPAVGASALWGYQAIYLLNDKRTGTFCDVVWITVKGI